MHLIALTGAKGSGKDTVADYLVSQHGYIKLALADALRAEIATAWQVHTAVLIDRAVKETPLRALALAHCCQPAFADWWMETTEACAERAMGMYSAHQLQAARSPRWVMQRWGDWRRATDPHYWITRAQQRINALPGQRIVITDVRSNRAPHQLNEVEFVRAIGGQLWQVRRPGTGSGDAHATETPIPIQHIDAVLENTGTIAELHALVDQYIRQASSTPVEAAGAINPRCAAALHAVGLFNEVAT